MTEDLEMIEETEDEEDSPNQRIRRIAWMVLGAAIVFLLGFGSGYLKWGQDETAELRQQRETAELYEQVNPKDGYALSVSYGDLGPRLIEGGVISYEAFAAIYQNSGRPLSATQTAILQKGSDEEIVVNVENAHFLLNFFWAVGLANENKILTEGPMVRYSNGQIDRFASTGGWTLATQPVTELYASMELIPLTAEQQALLEEVASAVYRPCCNNHTLFPDCNHGMAMLGLLQLMASQGATAGEMFEAAKYVNAYWFPQQTLETATYLQLNEGTKFLDADARLVVGSQFSSASGAGRVHEALANSGLLEQAPGQGGGCTN